MFQYECIRFRWIGTANPFDKNSDSHFQWNCAQRNINMLMMMVICVAVLIKRKSMEAIQVSLHWICLCEKTKDNFYLHLDKLWKLDNVPAKAQLISLEEDKWKANQFDGGSEDDEWKFSPGVLHFYRISDLIVFFTQLYWHQTFVFLGDP